MYEAAGIPSGTSTALVNKIVKLTGYKTKKETSGTGTTRSGVSPPKRNDAKGGNAAKHKGGSKKSAGDKS